MEEQARSRQDAEAVVAAFHAVLNDPRIVPTHAYRRNKIHYPLVGYVNNAVGLWLSKIYEVVPVFVGRAMQHMAEFPVAKDCAAHYKLVTQYFAQLTYVLQSFKLVPEEDVAALIPAGVIALGEQAAPSPGLAPSQNAPEA